MAMTLKIAGMAFLIAGAVQFAGFLHLDTGATFLIFAGLVLLFAGEVLVRLGKGK